MRARTVACGVPAILCQIGLAVVSLQAVCGADAVVGSGQAPPFWTYQDFLAGRIPQQYSVRKGHPRLLITPENREDIIAKAKAAPRLFQRTIALAERGSGEPAILACGAIDRLGLIPGFQYNLSRAEYGRRGVALLMALVGAKNVESGWGFGGYRLGVPCGYDWLYPLLSQEQKQAVAKELVRLADSEALRGRNASGRFKGANSRLSGPNAPSGTQRMTLGLAFHGDGVDDAAAKRIVDSTFRTIWWNPDQGRTWPSVLQMVLFLAGGGWTEGASYFGFNYKAFPHFVAWKTATGQDYFARMGYFRNVPYWMAHSVVPNAPKGRPINTYVVPFFRYNSRGVRCNKVMAAATGYLRQVDPAGAALAQWWMKRYPGRGSGNTPDLVCDLNTKQRSLADKIAFAGLWRFHVVPKAKTTKHLFLHAIEATDSEVERPGVLTLVKSDGATAAQVGPNVVIFSANEAPLGSASITVAAPAGRVVVGDLVPGRSYSVTAGGKTIEAKASPAGALLVKGLSLRAGQTLELSASAEQPK